MAELEKIHPACQRVIPGWPRQLTPVLDDLQRARMGLSKPGSLQKWRVPPGVILTELNGTAKGGVVISHCPPELNLPIRFMGVHEKIDVCCRSNRKSLWSRCC